MTDTFDKKTRSMIMAQVKDKDTSPEKAVRSLLHQMGFRFRLHNKLLPGKPDICLPKHRTVIFVHGCFWHRHKGCKRASTPTSNVTYWLMKFARNVERDRKNARSLKKLGWNVITIWECQLTKPERLANRLALKLKNNKQT